MYFSVRSVRVPVEQRLHDINITPFMYYLKIKIKKMLGAYCAINFTRGFTIKHSEKKTVHVYPQSHQTYLQDAYTRHTIKPHNGH